MDMLPPPGPADNPGTPRPAPSFVPTRAGPQAGNQIAATFDEQLARAFAPRPKPSRREAESAELAAMRRQIKFMLRHIYGERRGGLGT